MHVDVRRARAHEAPALTRLARRSKAHWGYPDELLRMWDRDLCVSADFIATSPVWCATCYDQVVGFYGLVCQDGRVELEHLWVVPEWIGRGVGRVLLEHALSEVRAIGSDTLVVVSDPHARGFYEHFGAELMGEHESVPAGRALPVLSIPVH